MTTQTQYRTLAREALKLVETKAPAIVDERILAEMFDAVAEYTGDIMGKLTTIDAEDETSVTLAHGIVRDGLLKEIIKQINKTMLDEAENRFKKLSK